VEILLYWVPSCTITSAPSRTVRVSADSRETCSVVILVGGCFEQRHLGVVKWGIIPCGHHQEMQFTKQATFSLITRGRVPFSVWPRRGVDVSNGVSAGASSDNH
jgi:hypothetical protein